MGNATKNLSLEKKLPKTSPYVKTGYESDQQYGPFQFAGIPFFPVIAWTVFFIMFFYFMPEEKPWNYVFIVISASYATLFSNILMNLEILQWKAGRLLIPYIIYISWFSFATWAFNKYGPKKE